MGNRLSPGCGCCGCREFSKQWCGIATVSEAATAGVTLSGSEYSVDYDLPDYDWTVIVTFPEIRERADYYAGGYCGEGDEWGSGTLKHTIRLTNQSDVVLLTLDVTISKDVSGVSDHVLIEVSDTTSDFEAVNNLSPYATSAYARNGGRYIRSMTITRREGITSVELQGNRLLVDPTPDGEGFVSLTESAAIYPETEGSASDTMRISFETTHLSGDFAEPTGDWIVTGYEIANPSKGTGLDCVDPRICNVNDSSYSSPQWYIGSADFTVSGLTMFTDDYTKFWSGCTGEHDQRDKPTFAEENPGAVLTPPVGATVPWGFGVYENKVSITYSSIGDAFYTGSWGALGTESFTPVYYADFTTTLLSSPNPGKRYVVLEMSGLYSVGGRTSGIVAACEWITPIAASLGATSFSPALSSQISGLEYIDGLWTSFQYWDYHADGTAASGYVLHPHGTIFVPAPTPGHGSDAYAPSGFGSVTDITLNYLQEEKYRLLNVTQPNQFGPIGAKWMKEVDEWDGTPPTITFGTADWVQAYPALSQTFSTYSSMACSYDGVQVCTQSGGLPDLRVHKFLLTNTAVSVDLETDASITIRPTTGPMPQPVTPV